MNREIRKHWLNTSTWSSSISLVATKHFPFSSSYLNLYKTKSVQWFIFLVGVLLSSVISTVDTFSLLQLKVRWHFSNTILIKFFCKNAHDVFFVSLNTLTLLEDISLEPCAFDCVHCSTVRSTLYTHCKLRPYTTNSQIHSLLI